MNEREDERLADDPEMTPGEQETEVALQEGGARRNHLEEDGRGQHDGPIRGTTKPTKLFDTQSEEARLLEAQGPEPGPGKTT